MQHHKAVQYYNNALEIRKAMNDEAGTGICFQLLGNVYLGKKEYETAKLNFKKSLTLNLKLQKIKLRCRDI